MGNMEGEPVQDIMTPDQVAAYLQMNKETVLRLIRRRELAASRIGRTYRIPRQDLEAFLLTHSTRPQVRQVLFSRVNRIAERNPDMDSDVVLAELEQEDAARQHPAQAD
jgi:excisionase family DNA binding protein